MMLESSSRGHTAFSHHRTNTESQNRVKRWALFYVKHITRLESLSGPRWSISARVIIGSCTVLKNWTVWKIEHLEIELEALLVGGWWRWKGALRIVVGDHRNRVPTVELIETNCIRFFFWGNQFRGKESWVFAVDSGTRVSVANEVIFWKEN